MTKKVIEDTETGETTEAVFTYDAAGNITAANENTKNDAFVYDTNNRLTEYNGTALEYDLDGNMLSAALDGEAKEFTFDASNRLVSVGANTYTYNAENIRIRNLCGESETKYLYDTNAKLSRLLVKTTDGKVTKYVYGRGLIGEEENSSFKTYHFDFRGSTIAITDEAGNITDTFAYDTYGKLIARTGETDTVFLYDGRDGVVTDHNGLLYMRARYYSPELRRFVNADILSGKISNAITLNRYAYANGNPVSNIDPFGLSADNRSSPTALEAAYMADHIYGATTEMCGIDLDEKFGGWKLVSIYDPVLKNIGLKVGVYQKIANDEISYCLVYAGTNMNWLEPDGTFKDFIDSCSDWVNNIRQPQGLSSDMRDGINFAKRFNDLHSNESITIIGHSKGGAEAAAAAVATNSNAILFNPASVALGMYGLDSEDYTANMKVYVVEGEILNNIFGGISTPIDEFEYLYCDEGGMIDKHLMKTVISALEKQESDRE